MIEKTNSTDVAYGSLLYKILYQGTKEITRNSEVYTNPFLQNTIFEQFPLVTVRKTAVIKAIREMEWFLSGNNKCPDELLDWWKSQLNYDNRLLDGYSDQFRYSVPGSFDQVKFIIDGLKTILIVDVCL